MASLPTAIAGWTKITQTLHQYFAFVCGVKSALKKIGPETQ
jgi:hypothetical protein